MVRTFYCWERTSLGTLLLKHGMPPHEQGMAHQIYGMDVIFETDDPRLDDSGLLCLNVEY